MRDKLIEILKAHLPHPSDEEYHEAADAIIAALPGMVKPLEWRSLSDKWGTETCGRIQITQRGCRPYWDLSCASRLHPTHPLSFRYHTGERIDGP